MATIARLDCHAIFILCLATLASGVAAGTPIPPVVPDTFRGSNLGRHFKADPTEKVFNVLDYEAKGDGKHDDSMSFVHAWIAACRNHSGKARVLIPEGTYKLGPAIFGGPCTNPVKPIVFDVKGTLLGRTDLSLYEESYWLLFESIDGLVITGNGVFDGQGSSVWKHSGDCTSTSDNCIPLPASIKFNSVTNGVLRGITSLDAKGVHIFITDSQNIRVRHLNISAPRTSPNTDGIHISDSNNVKIAKTKIATGDDCIGMIQGSTNIAVNNVVCGPGHGISIGSLGKYESENDVRGISVKKSTFIDTDNGIRIKSWPGSGPSKASGMVFQDLTMENVRNPIIINQQYCTGSCNSNQPSGVKISNVHYINVKGTTSSDVGVDFICSSSNPCENIELRDIDLKRVGPNSAAGLKSVCQNAKLGHRGVQNPPACH